jgi:hypothetical protein
MAADAAACAHAVASSVVSFKHAGSVEKKRLALQQVLAGLGQSCLLVDSLLPAHIIR